MLQSYITKIECGERWLDLVELEREVSSRSALPNNSAISLFDDLYRPEFSAYALEIITRTIPAHG